MNNYTKRIIIAIMALCMGYLAFSSGITFATSDGTSPFYEVSQTTDPNEDNLAIAQNITSNELTTNTSTFARIRDFFGMGTYTAQGETTPALVYVKTIVNRLLSLVSLISLIMVIAAFYMIFFSKQEESVGKAKKMLIGVIIALVVMGLSRYIVSYFFNIYSVTTQSI